MTKKQLKGTLQVKTIKGRKYAYDAYYDPITKQIKTDYLGRADQVNHELTKVELVSPAELFGLEDYQDNQDSEQVDLEPKDVRKILYALETKGLLFRRPNRNNYETVWVFKEWEDAEGA